MTVKRPDGGRRAQVLRAVRDALAPVGVADLAERLMVHPNTVRFHLDALERAGEVERSSVARAGRGRPRIGYRLGPEARGGERRYELLAGILASGLGGTDRGSALAADAGYAWGFARAQSAALGEGGEGDAVGHLLGLLGEIGFEPRRAGADTVELLNCPFHEAVESHGELICGIHAGLMRGALAGWDAQVDVSALEPFASPGLCRARLSSTASACPEDTREDRHDDARHRS